MRMTRLVHDRVLAFWYLFDLGDVRRNRRNEDFGHHHIGDGLIFAKVSAAAKITHPSRLGSTTVFDGGTRCVDKKKRGICSKQTQTGICVV